MFIKLTEIKTNLPMLVQVDHIVCLLRMDEGCRIYTTSPRREYITVYESLVHIAAKLEETYLVDPDIYKE